MSLTETQRAFVTSRAPFPAFVGGFGSGKTAAAIARIMALKVMCRQQDMAYYLPTYPLVEDIAYRRFPDLCERKGWAYKLNKASSFIEFPGAGRIVFRTMERPERIVGYEVAHSVCDELDTLPIEKAREVWSKVIARNRQKCGMANTVAVATTPEGFRLVYELWEKRPAPGYVLFRAKTMDNAANLPAGYIENLRNTYSSQQLLAYLDGVFTNLTAGSVYPEFDRRRHHTSATMGAGEPLHIGMDFNVTKMAAVVFVMRDARPVAVGEHVDVYDTPAMIELLKAHYPGRRILVYPDSSGGGRRSTNASISDIALLKGAGFQVCANPSNPPVKDRVASVNKLLREGGLMVNTDACPSFAQALEQQAYDKNGEPDKTTGHDHVNDAAGYFCAYRFPVERPATVRPGQWVAGMI